MTEQKLTYADMPWLKSYKLGPYKLATTIDVPEQPIYKFLDDSAAKYPDNVVLLFQKKRMTYKELLTYTDKLAAALAGLGVKKGDRVVTMVPNCPQIIISEYGIAKAGAVYVPLTPLVKAFDFEHVLKESGAEVIIALEDYLPIINSVKEKTKLKHIIISSRQDFTPEEEEIKEVPGTINFRRLLEENEAKAPEIEIDPMKDLATLAFTGGATGVPKGVMRTHYNETCAAMTAFPWMLKPMEAGARSKASFLTAMPLYHGAGRCFIDMAVYWSMRFILLPDPRDTDAIIDAIHEYRPFVCIAVPTQLMRMVQKKVGKTSSLVSTGAAPVPKEVADLWTKETGMPASQGYGITEGGTMFNLSAFSKLTGFMPVMKHALGVPSPNLECKLVDEVTGEEVPFGEVGEIWFRGPHVMVGYWPNWGDGLNEEGWLATGDVARMDEDGYFYMEDRIKDMISVSGLKVYSCTVDEVLFKHPSVAMAVAIGIPDPETPGSERVKAYIKVRDDYKAEVTAEEIIAHCRANLPPYACPRFVEFRDELPLTASEKLFKRALREEEINKMKAEGKLK